MPSKIFTVALVATGAFAASISTEPAPYTAPYSWTVHNFNGTCSAATCFAWDFSISGPGGPAGQPAFIANDCDLNTRDEVAYQLCNSVENNVSASVGVQIYGANYHGGLLSVQYTFQQGPIRYTYHGNHSVVRRGQGTFLEPAEFTIVPYAVSAVGI